ncbi:outer-membrane lipoprotein carrier protein LolA [Hydrogenivirga sp. 128-5-R1-1]|uniref:LolA family protein n=1 Tax=Hydrogenivirga sp. 128-5-R1-1 TaxID=392423 RepID=UPI00015F2E1F|nr:outer-membrane lipoprotein carrier protein LolA [Hydrogenivirga sp. 128-5-R1-1]EDP74612.1 hypothetical protein HG1285_08341 [Hydrogenivirga sp. 128-5-R1-1]
MRLIVFVLLFLTPLIAVSSTFKELEDKLKDVKSVRVVFVQKTRYSWYPKPELSKGVFYAMKDGKFRIEYTYPDEVVMVSNGKEIIILNKEDREAIIDSVENNTSPVIESLFFFSKPLSEVFEPVGELEKKGLKVLILKPKRKDENIKEVYVELDKDLEVRRIRVVDSEDTQTTVEFIDIRKNFKPSAGLFRIELPPDVKVRRTDAL